MGPNTLSALCLPSSQCISCGVEANWGSLLPRRLINLGVFLFCFVSFIFFCWGGAGSCCIFLACSVPRVSRQTASWSLLFITAVVCIVKTDLAPNDVFRLHVNLTQTAVSFVFLPPKSSGFQCKAEPKVEKKTQLVYLEQRHISQPRCPLPTRRQPRLLGFHRCTCSSRCFPLLHCK